MVRRALEMRFNPTMVRLGRPAPLRGAGRRRRFNPTMVRLGPARPRRGPGPTRGFNPTMVRLGLLAGQATVDPSP